MIPALASPVSRGTRIYLCYLIKVVNLFMRQLLNGIFLSLLLLTLSAAIEAQTDTVTITGGSIKFASTLFLAGDGLSIHGTKYYDYYSIDTSIRGTGSLSRTFVNDPLNPVGSFTLAGVTYPQWSKAEDDLALYFSSADFTIPANSPSSNFTFSAPFTMTGAIHLYLGETDPPQNVYIKGQGIATVEYKRDSATPTIWYLVHEDYTFQSTPILITEAGATKALTLDSVTLKRSPFPILNSNNFSTDQHTRVMLFAYTDLLPEEQANAVTAIAEDEQNRVYPLTVEYVGRIPGFDWITQVNVRLPDGLANAGNVMISISLHDKTSSKVLLQVNQN